ncbi:MAG TPA: DUF4258 domain-containing protein [Aggregatilineales bacterium]|nr:DUF4258 domain-containing protein [Aggregatilineales bacterium]
MNDAILRHVHQAVKEKRYIFTDHALEEADNDDLSISDIVWVLLNGDLDSIFTDDPRGTRYVIRGDIEELEVDVVCRFNQEGILLIIITVYVVDL